ncbi:MAG: MotA/TolQ/ExbB proton channel family protein [Devosia nanyangense]|uniref:MotA/TolQ/ExbB proton channel family protein n=1 Tax=Paradevosia shaoguanensis TaxID=1335043 RepID=UPI000455BE88|nr:MotA/TolQ/ExbB proton channel family protein [Paradevosia shaoguanensis]KFL27280.1 hypothetical protein JP74_08940 [Devosia sp. 17-2-E-8]MBI4046567.1 MotA/TolQ/ExbB proton channel family protein [Devosia nanyangense]QMV03663.1 hypothetical protein GHV40_20195 [Devosia sp. D6-9]CDP53213.1 hypothetical protein [Devosia sp. DBB001]
MKYRTIAKLIAFNIVPLVALFFAWVFGLVQKSYAADSTNIVYLITAIFIVAMGLVFYRARQIDDELHESTWWVGQTSEFVQLTFENRLNPIVYMGYSLVVLGLIGTVVGFIFGLNGIDPNTMADLPTMLASLGTILQGVGIAFYTTLIGSIGDIWLGFNILILTGAMNQLQLRTLKRPVAA